MTVAATSQNHGPYGDAGALLHVDATDDHAADVAVSAAIRQFGPLEVIAHSSLPVPGSGQALDIRSQSPTGRFSKPLLALRRGRYPRTSTEVALTDGAAQLLSTDIGDRLSVAGANRKVVGRVENPSDLDDDFALVPDRRMAGATSMTLLVRSADRAPSASRGTRASGASSGSVSEGLGFQVMVAPNDHSAVAAFVLAVTTLGMALVSLLAAAGFVVVAQRRQHQLGLLAALGATERHLRLVTLANGAIVGTVAAVVGGAVGAVGAMAASPAVEHAVRHRIDRFDLPWQLIGACLAIAVVVAIAAAWWPARTIARVPVMAALARRPAPPRPVHRSVAVASVLLIIGTAGIASAQAISDHVHPLLLIAGLLATVVGIVFLSPAAIRSLGPVARRLPFASRVAVRDLVRYQARAAAALAAITLTLGLSVAVVGVAAASEARAGAGNLSNRQLLVTIDPAPLDPQTPAKLARLDADVGRVAAALGDPTPFALDVAVAPVAGDTTAREPIQIAEQVSSHSYHDLGHPWVATPQLLRHFGIDPARVRPGTDLLTSRPGRTLVIDVSARQDPASVAQHRQHVGLPTYSAAPNSLLTPGALTRHGWVRVRSGWFIELSKPLTGRQVSEARKAAAAHGFAIEVRSGHDESMALRNGATSVGALVALAILAMTIGLIRSEARRDLRTLTATGASARTRRALTAATAGALALLAVALSTSGSYVALVAAYHSHLARLFPLPVRQLLPLAVGLPAVAFVGGWLLAGREPSVYSRQALD